MFRCHKNHQQKYDNKHTKMCVFIQYRYVNILFPLKKVIPVMFEKVTSYYQTLQTWIGHNATRYHNLNALPYIFSQFNMV